MAKKSKSVSIIIDSSALKDMFEGKNKGKSDDLLKQMKRINESGGQLLVFTTMSSFQRAIFLADPEVKIQKIQKALSFLKILPSVVDFKNEEKTRNEILKVAQIFSGEKNDKN